MAKKRKGDDIAVTEKNPKPRVNARIPAEYVEGLDNLAKSEQRSNAGQIEHLIIKAVDDAIVQGRIPPLALHKTPEQNDDETDKALAIALMGKLMGTDEMIDKGDIYLAARGFELLGQNVTVESILAKVKAMGRLRNGNGSQALVGKAR